MKISAMQKMPNRLAVRMKNQSKRWVVQFFMSPNRLVAASGAASVPMTNRTMAIPEMRKTGLWMSSPNGPIFVVMLS